MGAPRSRCRAVARRRRCSSDVVAHPDRVAAIASRASDDLVARRPGARKGPVPTCGAVPGRQAAGLCRGGERWTNSFVPAAARRACRAPHSRDRGGHHPLLLTRWSMAGLLCERPVEESLGGRRRAADHLRSTAGVERDMGRRRQHRVRHNARIVRAVAGVSQRRRAGSNHDPQVRRGAARISATPSRRGQLLFSVRRKETRGTSRCSHWRAATGGCWAMGASSAKGHSIFRPGISSMRNRVDWSPRHSIPRAAIWISLRSHSSNASKRRDSEARTLPSRPAAGTLVYVPAGTTVADRTLLRVDRDGRVAPLIEAHAGYEYPAFSPDGRQIAVTIASETGSDIWIIDLERATRIRFTAGGTSAFPVWAPDGSTRGVPVDRSRTLEPLLEAARRRARSAAALANRRCLTRAAPGRTPEKPFCRARCRRCPAPARSFRCRGRPMVRRWPFTSESRTANVTSGSSRPASDPMPFLLTPFDERSPRFSPDGKWLAYVSDESGRNDVYVQPFPGRGANGSCRPTAGSIRCGRRMAASCSTARTTQMMAVSVAPKGGVFGEPPAAAVRDSLRCRRQRTELRRLTRRQMVRDAEGRIRARCRESCIWCSTGSARSRLGPRRRARDT